jgi:hypothetical protein
VRQVQERAAAQRLARATVEANQTAAREQRLRRALGGSDDDPRDARSLAALAASRAAGRSLLADLTALQTLQQEGVASARAEHHEARRETKGLTKLADAHERRWLAEQLRAEQIELDEIAGRRAVGEE